jgi:glyoxylase-like metal-dependent hydrolase (beta-lactamase superfamily II)
MIDYKNGIYAVDSDYVRPILDAIHLIEDSGEVAIVDCAHNDSWPQVEAALAKIGRKPEDVRCLILTHVHLDHAGGAGLFMSKLPNAKLVVHERGARHMIDPSKLYAGVEVVYGKETAKRLYGDLLPIPESRVVIGKHGDKIALGKRTLEILDTPGHARHHISIVDHAAKGIFSGDTFGLSYRELDVDGKAFIFPTTTPVNFEPDAMHASIDLMRSFKPEGIYLTHYSRVTEVDKLAEDLHRHIDALVDMTNKAPGQGEARKSAIESAMTDYLLKEVRAHGCTLPERELKAIFETDLDLNAQGLAYWKEQEEKKAGAVH